MMKGETQFVRFAWLVVFVLFLASPSDAQEGSAPLTRAVIHKVMAVRETANALREEVLRQSAIQKDLTDSSFVQALSQIQTISQMADEQACQKHKMDVAEYRQKLRRIANVDDLVRLENAKGELQAELKRRESLSDAELSEEAERQNAATEEWFRRIKPAKRSNGTSQAKTPGPPPGYADSLEETVMKPMRQQAASGKLVDLARQANSNRVEEIRGQLLKIEAELKTGSMRQAHRDKSVVLKVLDLETLQGVRTSVMKDLPAMPTK